MRQLTLSATLYPTESKALAAPSMLLRINGDEAFVQKRQATFGSLIDRYIEVERLKEIKALPPDEAFVKDGVQYATACSYLTSFNRYIRPRWNKTLLNDIKPAAVDEWLKSLTRLPKPGDDSRTQLAPLSPKTRGNIKSMIYRLMERAMFWELVPPARNPIGLVEIQGVSKRRKKPFILTIEQYHLIVEQLANLIRRWCRLPCV
jgi:integrase